MCTRLRRIYVEITDLEFSRCKSNSSVVQYYIINNFLFIFIKEMKTTTVRLFPIIIQSA